MFEIDMVLLEIYVFISESSIKWVVTYLRVMHQKHNFAKKYNLIAFWSLWKNGKRHIFSTILAFLKPFFSMGKNVMLKNEHQF